MNEKTKLLAGTGRRFNESSSVLHKKTRSLVNCFAALLFLFSVTAINLSFAATPEELKKIDQIAELIKKNKAEKNWEELIQQATQAIAQFPTVPGFFLERASAYKELKQFEPALTDYRRVRQALPNNPLSHLGIAQIFLAQQQPALAEEALTEGLKIAPSFSSLLHLSTLANLQLGRKDLAERRFSALKRVNPQFAEAVAGGLRELGLGSAESTALISTSTYAVSLQQALKDLRAGNVDAARKMLAELYAVDRKTLLQAGGMGLDSDVVSALYVAEVLQLNLINATTMYGDFDLYSRADDFAYSLYEHYLKSRGPADSLTLRALAAAVIAHTSFGRLPLALERLTRGTALAGNGARPSDAAVVQLAFSNLYMAMGRKKEAQFAALRTQELLKNNTGQTEDLNLLSLSFLQNALFSMSDAKNAEKVSDELTTKLQQLKLTNTIFAADNALIKAQILIFLGKTDASIKWNETGFTWLKSVPSLKSRPQHRNVASTTSKMSWLASAFGNHDIAAKLQEHAVLVLNDSLGAGAPVTTISEVNLVPALIKASRLGDALTLSRKIVPKLEALRSDLDLAVEDRMSVFGRVARAYRDSAFLELDGDPTRSFRASEQSKARALLESNMVRRALASGVLERADSDKLESLGRNLLALDQQVASARLVGQSTVDAELKRQQITNEKKTLERSFLVKYPKYAKLSDVQISSPTDVAALIQTNEVFISYLVTADNLLIYVINKGGFRALKVPVRAGAIKDLVASARTYYSGQVPVGDPAIVKGKQAAEQLIKLIFDPIKSELATATGLVIAPDESLAMLPFDALDFEGKPLVMNKDVTMIQSGSLFVLARQELKIERKFDLDLLAVGGPQYEQVGGELEIPVAIGQPPTTNAKVIKENVPEQNSKDVSSLFSFIKNTFNLAMTNVKSFFAIKKVEPKEIDVASFVRGSGGDSKVVARAFAELKNRWPELPGAQQEVTEVAALFPEQNRTVIKGRDASELRLQQLNASGQLAKYRYLLFSTHGYLSMFEPALSSVVLSQTNTTDDADGYVTASEWAGYRLNSELIVLSACDTAVGEIIQGEGITGLPYAMSVAGNRRSVLTLWPVADDGTREFMVAFFTKIRAGKAVKTALAETKREFITHKTFSAPIYWAPFVLYGG